MLKDSAKNIILLLFSTVLTILLIGSVLEVYFRRQYSKNHKDLELKYQGRELCTRSSHDRNLIYESIPNKCGVNSKGYRDYEYTYVKEDDTLRIIVIGDSVVQGQGIKLDKTFPKILEKKLNNNLENKKFEVVVLAQTGYSTSQELVLLRKEVFRYHPDLIIWSYVLNDPAHPVYHGANGELGRYFFKPKSHFLHFILENLFFIKERVKSTNCSREFHEFLHCVYWKEVESNIKEIGVISEEKNVPIIFLIHPVFEKNAYKTYSLSSLHKKLAQLASGEGLIVWDILDAYKHYNAEEIKMPDQSDWYDCWHSNSKGHKIMGDYLYKKIGTATIF